jgi:hypothetical protein
LFVENEPLGADDQSSRKFFATSVWQVLWCWALAWRRLRCRGVEGEEHRPSHLSIVLSRFHHPFSGNDWLMRDEPIES